MDGRRIRRWLCSGLLVAGVGCKGTNSNGFGLLKSDNQPAGMVVTPPKPSKPLWGGSSQPPVGMPIEVAAAPPRRSSEKGFLPETEVEFANTHVEVALAEPPPPNRDQLLDMARIRYQRALKKDSKNKGALLGMARMYARLGDRERATEAFNKCMQVHPKDPEILYEMAQMHARWKDWAGAVTRCDAALKLDPENRIYRKTMGFCLARDGRWEDARAVLCQIMPEAQARYNIAHVMDDMNYLKESRQELQLALQADPNFAPARDILAALEQGGPADQPRTAVPAQEPNPIRQVSGTSINEGN